MLKIRTIRLTLEWHRACYNQAFLHWPQVLRQPKVRRRRDQGRTSLWEAPISCSSSLNKDGSLHFLQEARTLSSPGHRAGVFQKSGQGFVLYQSTLNAHFGCPCVLQIAKISKPISLSLKRLCFAVYQCSYVIAFRLIIQHLKRLPKYYRVRQLCSSPYAIQLFPFVRLISNLFITDQQFT